MTAPTVFPAELVTCETFLKALMVSPYDEGQSKSC